MTSMDRTKHLRKKKQQKTSQIQTIIAIIFYTCYDASQITTHLET